MGELSLSARLSVFDAAQWAETLSPEPELRAQYGLCVQRLPGAVVCRCAATPISFFKKAFLDPTLPGGDAALLCGGASPGGSSQRNLERQGLHFIHDSEQYEWTL